MSCCAENHQRNKKERQLVSYPSLVPFIVQFEGRNQQVHLFYVAKVTLFWIIRNFFCGNISHFFYVNEVADYSKKCFLSKVLDEKSHASQTYMGWLLYHLQIASSFIFKVQIHSTRTE